MRRAIGISGLILFVLATVVSIASAEDEARVEYNKLLNGIMQKHSAMPMLNFINHAESELLGFLEKYPGTSASGSARVSLGRLYSDIGRHEDAVKTLNVYLAEDYEKLVDEKGMAWLTLGNSQLALENFDEAEKVFKKLSAAGSDVNQKMRMMASQMLGQIEILRKLTIGSSAIDFSAVAIDGKALKLSDYRGKVVLLDFWATWCTPCRKEMPNVLKVYNDLHGKGFDIVGVSLDNDRRSLDNYIDEMEIKWRQVYDGKGWQSDIGRMYAVNSIPATFLIDKRGVIRFKNLHGEDLYNNIRKLLAEK